MTIHSTGILFVDGGGPAAPPDIGGWSFRVTKAGKLYGGDGGFANPVDIAHLPIHDLDSHPNPPEGRVVTVYVEDADGGGYDRRAVLKGLVDAHRDRFKECRLWVLPAVGAMAAWVDGGMVVADGSTTRGKRVEPAADGGSGDPVDEVGDDEADDDPAAEAQPPDAADGHAGEDDDHEPAVADGSTAMGGWTTEGS